MRTLAQFHGSEVSLGLFQDFTDGYIKTLRLSPLALEHSVVVTTAGFQNQDDPRLNPMGIQISFPVLLNLCSESVWV